MDGLGAIMRASLEEQEKVSHYTVSKMYSGENITIDMLERICKALNCTPDDVMEFILDEDDKTES